MSRFVVFHILLIDILFITNLSASYYQRLSNEHVIAEAFYNRWRAAVNSNTLENFLTDYEEAISDKTNESLLTINRKLFQYLSQEEPSFAFIQFTSRLIELNNSRGFFKESLHIIDNTLADESFTKNKYQSLKAKLLWLKSSILFESLNYKDHSALLLLLEAKKIYQDIKDKEGEFLVIRKIALYLYKFKQYKKALKLYEIILNDGKQYLTNKAYMNTINSIGLCYKKLGNYKKALARFEESLTYAHEIDDEFWVGCITGNIGELYALEGKYDKAIPLIKKDLEISKKYDESRNVCSALKHLGSAFFKIGNIQEAEKYFNELLNYGFSPKSEIIEAYYYLGKINEIKNLEKEALFYYEKNRIMKDSILRDYDKSKSTEIQIERVFELFENKQLREKLEKTNLTQVAIIKIGAIFFIILLIFIVKLYRDVSKNKKVKEQFKHENLIILKQKEEAEHLNRHLTELVAEKEKDLALNTMYIAKRNEIILDIQRRNQQLIKKLDSTQQQELKKIDKELNAILKEGAWKDFETRFKDVHPEFMKRIQDKFPSLTQNERRLCVFLKLNMTTKEISGLTSQSIHSITVARTRLRKKLNLTNTDQNLASFIQGI